MADKTNAPTHGHAVGIGYQSCTKPLFLKENITFQPFPPILNRTTIAPECHSGTLLPQGNGYPPQDQQTDHNPNPRNHIRVLQNKGLGNHKTFADLNASHGPMKRVLQCCCDLTDCLWFGTGPSSAMQTSVPLGPVVLQFWVLSRSCGYIHESLRGAVCRGGGGGCHKSCWLVLPGVRTILGSEGRLGGHGGVYPQFDYKQFRSDVSVLQTKLRTSERLTLLRSGPLKAGVEGEGRGGGGMQVKGQGPSSGSCIWYDAVNQIFVQETLGRRWYTTWPARGALLVFVTGKMHATAVHRWCLAPRTPGHSPNLTAWEGLDVKRLSAAAGGVDATGAVHCKPCSGKCTAPECHVWCALCK